MQTDTQTVHVSKKALWAGRIISGLPALFLLVDGVMKLVKPAPVVEATVHLGYSENVILPLGIVLLICTVLYLIARTSVLGAILLTGYLGGAVATHVRAGEGAFPILLRRFRRAHLAGTLPARWTGARTRPSARRRAIMNIVLWIIQALLALLFLFAGGTKLVLSIEAMRSMGSPNQILLPGLLIRFIGVCEVLGALGLILPGLWRTKTGLTPLAAAGLVIIMIGATVLSFATDGVAMSLFPLVICTLTAFVAYGRWRLAPHRDRSGA